MKIIEAMKRIKHLQEKCADLRKKVGMHCATMSFETLTYQDQGAQIAEWISSHHDTVREIEKLRVSIQRTNLNTKVTMDIGGASVTKSISCWIQRRKDLAKMELDLYAMLSDQNLAQRGMKEGAMLKSSGESVPVTINRHYDPKLRDEKMQVYKAEPTIIDGYLEVANAVTDLIEA